MTSSLLHITNRVNNIDDGSDEDACMDINIENTVTLHVREQDETSPTSPDEALSVCKFRCPHLNCGFEFLTNHGMQVHTGRCEWKNEFEVDFTAGDRESTVTRQ